MGIQLMFLYVPIRVKTFSIRPLIVFRKRIPRSPPKDRNISDTNKWTTDAIYT